MIRLRDVQSKDKEMIRQWRNKPEVAKYMYTDHYITREEHNRWFERISSESNCRYWVIVCDQVDVGLVNIYDVDEKNQRCFWAFYVADPSARGKGVGSFVEYSILKYVFEDLEFNKLCCEVLGFNDAVVNMHKGFGFKEEGFFREHIIKGDQIFDVVRLAILRREWEAKKMEIEDRLREKGVL
jgi:UDP-4-amino-4,6-dideoxy-N-acetyl-beta-L-altrosamine N-acetyltransferase